MAFIKEFKEFAVKSNLIDTAIAFVIGGAFAKVTTSFIDGIVMPPIGKLMGNVDFSKLQYVIQDARAEVTDASGIVTHKAVAEVAIKYGAFVNTIVDFLIVAFVMFMVIKGMNKMKRKHAEIPAPPAEPTKQEILLTEIRDLLKK